MTCYEYIEHLRKKQIIESKLPFNRLNKYLEAVEENTEVEYHKKHGRG